MNNISLLKHCKLNGIFRYAVLNEMIPYNPITSLPCNELKFKCPTAKKNAYTVQDTTQMAKILA